MLHISIYDFGFTLEFIALILFLGILFYVYQIRELLKTVKEVKIWTVLFFAVLIIFIARFMMLFNPVISDDTQFIFLVFIPILFLISNLMILYSFYWIYRIYSKILSNNKSKKNIQRDIFETYNKTHLDELIRFFSVFIILIGLLVIYGWLSNLEILKSILPWFPSMKFYTALCFIIIGLSFLNLSYKSNYKNKLSIFFGVFLFLISTLLFVTSFSSFDLLLSIFPSDLELFKTVKPGLPSLGTISLFLLFGVILILNSLNKKYIKSIKHFGIISITLGIFAIIGYILDIQYLYWHLPNISGGMAIHTAILFIIIGINSLLYFEIKKYEN